MKRNLLFHIAPLANVALDYNLQFLKKYIHLFNGRRIVHVSSGPSFLEVDHFKKIFIDNVGEVEFLSSENDPVNRETTPFIHLLLPNVASTNSDEITFFCHAKGISNCWTPKQNPSLLWAKYMYDGNLSDINLVEDVMSKYGCAGCFRNKFKYPLLNNIDWHFSGTFFWFNHQKLFSRNWKNIIMSRYGTEAYPATQFSLAESYCLAFEMLSIDQDAYLQSTWDRMIPIYNKEIATRSSYAIR